MANYAYHLDAGKFAPFLQRHCATKLGVRHVLADVPRVKLAEDGDIRSVDTEQAGEIEGDLFVDCTGFRALLIGEALGVPFKDCSDVLFCDTALAVQVPYESDATARSPAQTISTAQSAGWIWDIGLPDAARHRPRLLQPAHRRRRRPSASCAPTSGRRPRTCRCARSRSARGHRETFWKRNCVAVGLAAGFLEPLESSAIVLIELSAKLIAEQMPACREVMDVDRVALQRDDALSLGPDHRFPQAPLRADASGPTARSGATTSTARDDSGAAAGICCCCGDTSRPGSTTSSTGSRKCSPPRATSTCCTAWASAPRWIRRRLPARRPRRARDARERGADRAPARRIAAPPRADPQDLRTWHAGGLSKDPWQTNHREGLCCLG